MPSTQQEKNKLKSINVCWRYSWYL